jgi:outer membrane protein assembly factor BamB
MGPGNQSNGRVAITNDPGMLAGRVTYPDQDVPIDGSGVGYAVAAPLRAPSLSGQAQIGARSALVASNFSLRLVYQVAPPSIGGQALQATSIVISGNHAVASYNMAGSQVLGGVDLFDWSTGPVLRSEALFQKTKINAVTLSGQNVFVAEATSDTGFLNPAVFEIMQIQGSNLVLNGNRRMDLTSYAGTSTTSSGTRVYVTSGNTGSLFAIDPVLFTVIDSIRLHDARWVDVAGGKVVVAEGTPGQIAVFNEATLVPLGTFPFTGADIPESKSTVQVVGGKAFIAAGSAGVQILSVSTGKVVGSVPRPDPASLGLSPSVVVTNAVSVSGDLMFISNGEAGVYVAQGSQDFSTSGSETPQQITMLGRLRFDNLQSVNHVTYLPPYLVIAAGLGGIKVVQVSF